MKLQPEVAETQLEICETAARNRWSRNQKTLKPQPEIVEARNRNQKYLTPQPEIATRMQWNYIQKSPKPLLGIAETKPRKSWNRGQKSREFEIATGNIWNRN